jgi:hypothetical protein
VGFLYPNATITEQQRRIIDQNGKVGIGTANPQHKLVPEVAAMGDLVYLAANPVEFASQVTRALEEDSPSQRARRKEIAARESWTSPARAISAESNTLLACSPDSGTALPAPNTAQNLPSGT